MDQCISSCRTSIFPHSTQWKNGASVLHSWQSHLSNTSLDDLLLLKTQAIPLDQFNPDPSIDLRWPAKSRRPFQKEYKLRLSDTSPSTSASQSLEDESEEDILQCWDELMDTTTTPDDSTSDRRF